MEVSKTVNYVMDEASAEASRGMKRFISQEHIFLGILKLTGKTAVLCCVRLRTIRLTADAAAVIAAGGA